MNIGERRFHAETSIRAYMVVVAKLEGDYLLAKAEEIANGKFDRSPFLKSRTIQRLIGVELRKAWGIERAFNKMVSASQSIALVIGIVKSDPVFVQANRILTKLYNNSEAQLNSIARRQKELEKMIQKADTEKWPKAEDTMKFAKDPEIQALIARMKAKRQVN